MWNSTFRSTRVLPACDWVEDVSLDELLEQAEDDPANWSVELGFMTRDVEPEGG